MWGLTAWLSMAEAEKILQARRMPTCLCGMQWISWDLQATPVCFTGEAESIRN